MKILIVDDELLIRKKLVQIILQSSLGFDEVLQADSVDSAIELLDKYHPSILLTDINMPEKNGLQLIKYVYENDLECISILITGYAEFEYAQTAIKYNVFDYILKPIDIEKTINCIKKAKQKFTKIHKEQSMYNIFREYFIKNHSLLKKQFLENVLFNNVDTNMIKKQKEMFDFTFNFYRVVIFKSTTNSKNIFAEEGYYYSYIIEKYILEYFNNPIKLTLADTVYLLISDDKEQYNEYFCKIKHDIEKIYPVNILIGISDKSSDLSKAQILKGQAFACIEYQTTNTDNDFIYYEDIKDNINVYSNLSEYINQLNMYIQTYNFKSALLCVNSIYNDLSDFPLSQVKKIFMLILTNMIFFLNYTDDENIDTNDTMQELNNQFSNANSTIEIKQLTNQWVYKFCNIVNNLQKNKNNNLINIITDYIKDNYHRQIGLTDVAEFVSRNPSYISRLIKQYTDKNFTQLLTEKRIDEAKTLLKDTTLKIIDISEKVGYPNIRYFNRIFNSYVGMTPNDYRKIVSTLINDN